MGTVRGAAEEQAFGLKLVAEGFVSPTAAVSIPGQKGAMLIADQPGTIHRLNPDGTLADQLFLDLRPKMTKLNQGFDERGLLGLALHPKFAENRKFYVAYSAPKRPEAPENWDHTMLISEFTADSSVEKADTGRERVLLQIDQPYFNHNGGCLVFGPDGFLYIPVGDGGNANDEDEASKPKGRPPEGNAQNLNTLLGKILRIDVNTQSGYAVPKDNPFVGKQGKYEIYAYGLRNPWRISFDRGGQHELFAADVGQDAYEEVNIIRKGGNYGWKIREGFHCFVKKGSKEPSEDCPKVGSRGEPLLDPIFEYVSTRFNAKEGKGISITGGYVYRGNALPGWKGKYIFADWSRLWVKPEGVLYSASPGADGKWSIETLQATSHPNGLGVYITAFGEDAEGELYILTNGSNALIGKNGKIFKLVPM